MSTEIPYLNRMFIFVVDFGLAKIMSNIIVMYGSYCGEFIPLIHKKFPGAELYDTPKMVAISGKIYCW